MVTERRFTPRVRKRAMQKPVKQTGSPKILQLLDDEVLAKVEQELGLTSPNEKLRNRLNDCVFDYVWFSQHKPPKQAAVRGTASREIPSKAARKLQEKLEEDETERTARAAVRAEINRQINKRKITAGEMELIEKAMQQLPKKQTGKLLAAIKGLNSS